MVHVVTHNAASVDGRIDRLGVDVETYYELTGRFEPDAHLVGSDTLVEGMAGAGDDDAAGTGAPEAGGIGASEVGGNGPSMEEARQDADASAEGFAPVLVVPDSRGRIDDWEAIRAQPYWRGPIVLCSRSTPDTYLATLDEQGVEYHVAGDDHVDYEGALTELETRDGIETVLVDSGGTLSGHLFRSGLVDEVSLLLHPQVVGGTTARSFVRGPDPEEGEVTACSLESVERMAGDLVWLRYAVVDA